MMNTRTARTIRTRNEWLILFFSLSTHFKSDIVLDLQLIVRRPCGLGIDCQMHRIHRLQTAESSAFQMETKYAHHNCLSVNNFFSFSIVDIFHKFPLNHNSTITLMWTLFGSKTNCISYILMLELNVRTNWQLEMSTLCVLSASCQVQPIGFKAKLYHIGICFMLSIYFWCPFLTKKILVNDNSLKTGYFVGKNCWKH